MTDAQKRTLASGGITLLTPGNVATALARQVPLCLINENGSVSALGDDHMDELRKVAARELTNESWLQCTFESVFFQRDGVCQLVCESVDNVPLLVRQVAHGNTTEEASLRPGVSLHLVVDQSGSMRNMNDAVYDGAREVVESLPTDAVVTFTTFNTTVHPGTRKSRKEAITQLPERIAQGSTALRDAIIDAIHKEEQDPYMETTLVIVTDGIDNASKATVAQVRMAIARCDARGWRCLFLGANQDAIVSAQQYGIDAARAMTFGTMGAPAAMRSASESIRDYRNTGEDAFTPLQRQASIAPTV